MRFSVRLNNDVTVNQAVALAVAAERVGFDLPVRPLPTAECAQGQALPLVNLSAPNDGAVIRGAVEIRGQAQAADFDRFELEFARVDAPDTWYPISASLVEMPHYGTTLGVWDTVTQGIPNGDYVLRLKAASTSDGSIIVERRLRVENDWTSGDQPVAAGLGTIVSAASAPTQTP